jgi:hypothetical protein
MKQAIAFCGGFLFGEGVVKLLADSFEKQSNRPRSGLLTSFAAHHRDHRSKRSSSIGYHNPLASGSLESCPVAFLSYLMKTTLDGAIYHSHTRDIDKRK